MTKLCLRGKIFFEMVINEIFYSLQGEGLLAGVPGVFIRLAGCSLRCTWCDTKYALDPTAGEELSVPEILDRIESVFPHSSDERPAFRRGLAYGGRATSHECRFVVITGGEPMVNPQLPQLAAELSKRGRHITIETAGIAFVENLACDLMSISPKLSNSGQKKVPDTFFAVRQLIEHYPYQLKFVVDSPDDLPEIQDAIEQIGNVIPDSPRSPRGEAEGFAVEAGRIMLMPQAKTRDELIAKSPMVAELCKQAGYTFCNRLQILLYNGVRGK
jgi:7-carboxy-7-deazaguanine synthase